MGEGNMKTDMISLTIDRVINDSFAIGTLYVYRVLDNSEQEIPVDVEFDYQAFEYETLESPKVAADLSITRVVDAATGGIEYEYLVIDNLDSIEFELLKMVIEHQEAVI